MEDRSGLAPPAETLRLYLSRLFLPLDEGVLVADPSAEGRAWLAAHLGPRPFHAVSRSDLLAQIKQRHDAQLLDEAVFGLARRFPQLSARTVITRPQMVALGAIGLVALCGLAFNPLWTVRMAMILLSLAFGLSGAFRVVLALFASFRRPVAMVQGDASLPSYTILVPMYREAAVLRGLVRGLGDLDYPRHLLDIKLVVEEDDFETVFAARALLDGDVPFEIVEVPPGGPRTKPNSDVALLSAISEIWKSFDFAWISGRPWPPGPCPPGLPGGLVLGM